MLQKAETITENLSLIQSKQYPERIYGNSRNICLLYINNVNIKSYK